MTERIALLCDLEVQSRKTLHDRALDVAADYRRCEADLFQIVWMIEDKKVYFDFGITSLFQYITDMLRLSRDAAYDLITVVRKSREVPDLKQAVLLEQISISKARRIASVITENNAHLWIDLAKHSSSRVVEKAVAQANPRSVVCEKVSYVSEDVLQFQLAVSESWSTLLNEIKDLMSQKEKRAVSSEEALFMLMSDYKRKHDPVLKAERAQNKAERVTNKSSSKHRKTACETIHIVSTDQKVASEAMRVTSIRNRRIPQAQVHRLHLRDRNQCSFTDRHGKRCSQKRWLQKHHVVHFADGGTHGAENLQTLCWAHHAMTHRV